MKKRTRLESLLPKFSLDRRITVLVLLATTLVVGLVSTVGIPLELFPRGFTASFLAVNVPWSDAPAREVLDKVILPLEEELATVKGLNRISSFSTTGFGRVFLSFKQNTDMDIAYREVRDRVQRARARMPEDADRVYIRKEDSSGFPVAMVGLGIDPTVTNGYDLIEKGIKMPLERLDGVAKVDPQGLEEKEILIELDRERTEAAGLNIYEIAQDLGSDNFSLASGSVYSGGKKLLLRSVARYPDLDAVRNRSVAPSVRVGDIASVTYEEPDKKYRVRVNGRPAVALQVFKEGEANTLAVSRRVHALVDKMQEDPRLAGVEMTVFFDQGSVILESLGTLLDSGKIGALFAVAVLFFFLRRARMTLIITLSVPLSMLIALTVMYFAGESLNILSLLGLMICIGLLVDNSVVVAENIYRMHKDGVPRRQACIRGASEIALAVTMATLTTVIVFLPVSLVEGEGQFFLLRMAIPVSVSLLASLFVALVFIPLSVYLTLPANGGDHRDSFMQRSHKRVNGVLARAYDATFERINRGYGRLLSFFLRRRLDLMLGILGVAVITGIAAGGRELKVVDQDEDERPGFEIDIELPQTYSFEETERFFLQVEEIMLANQEDWGLEGHFFFHRTNWGEIEGWFPSERTNDMTPRQVTEAVLEALPEAPGVEYYTGSEDESGADDESIYAITLNGEDPDQLETIVEDLEDVFASVDGVLGVKKLSSSQRQPNELSLVVDRDRAQKQEVNPQVIAGVVGYALRGQSLPKFYADGREIQVRVRFEEEDRESLAELSDFGVPTETGSMVPLASLTDVEYTAGAKSIFRREKRMARTITLELEEGSEEDTRKALTALKNRIDLPEGVVFGGRSRANTTGEETAAMGFAALMSILFIYLLMGFLFESFILPLSIVFTIPLAGIGVAWGHIIAGKNIDFLGMVGMVLLIGVVVNNGIVLIDYINRLRRWGHERSEAVLIAARRRFRPIMMTALTTIFGMIPLTLGRTSEIGISYKSFGYTLIGGLTTATLLTLLVVPVLYTLFDDARERFMQLFRRVFRNFGSAEPAPAE